MRVSSQTPPTAAPGGASPPSNELGRDEFLRLLMTQMNQQDPLSPMDNTQFVAQLSQFATLERLSDMATNVEALVMAESANTSAQMVGFIGKSVDVQGGSINVDADHNEAELTYELAGPAETITATITDDTGRVIREIELGPTDEGEHDLSWDLLDSDGNRVAEGEYTIRFEATNEDGEPVDVTTRQSREITGVRFDDGVPVFLLDGGGEASLGEVVSVHAD